MNDLASEDSSTNTDIVMVTLAILPYCMCGDKLEKKLKSLISKVDTLKNEVHEMHQLCLPIKFLAIFTPS